MHVKARAALDPSFGLRMFVCLVIVRDQMQVEIGSLLTLERAREMRLENSGLT